MPIRRVPQTWRLLQLTRASSLPCAACGQVHRYLTRVSTVGDCMPMLFPPGISVPLSRLLRGSGPCPPSLTAHATRR
jgi:hypothetical protein